MYDGPMRALLVLLAAIMAHVPVHAAGDAARGARFFHPCAHCHSTNPGEQMTGPSLAKIFNAKAGAEAGFTRYSEALKKSGKVWDAESLDKWIADPALFIPGNSMAFPGFRNAQAREDLVAYLRAVSEGTAPQRPPHPAARRIDLGKAPPEGQVRAITLCKDVYTVETADGHREKVPEANLRFRTESGELGPRPGKPVAIGTERDDGGVVVFASPAEISGFIRRACD